MIKFIITIQNEGNQVSVRCADLIPDPMLQGLIKLVGVKGLEDPALPEYQVDYFSIRPDQILNYCAVSLKEEQPAPPTDGGQVEERRQSWHTKKRGNRELI